MHLGAFDFMAFPAKATFADLHMCGLSHVLVHGMG